MVMGELSSIMLNLIPAYWSQSGIILNHNMSYETVTLEEVYDNQTKRMSWLTAYHSRVFSKDGFILTEYQTSVRHCLILFTFNRSTEPTLVILILLIFN
jgi:hypothetical protein